MCSAAPDGKREPDFVFCPDIARTIEDTRPGKTGMREKYVTLTFNGLPVLPPDRKSQPAKRHAGQICKREIANNEWGECRTCTGY